MSGKRKVDVKARRQALCWRHQLDMFWAAWSSLLDLSGRMYPRASAEVLWRAHRCERCEYRRY